MQELFNSKSLAAQLCRRCAQFYGNQKTDRLCSQCYLFFRQISAFGELYTDMKKTSLQNSSNKIRSGLVLYAFKGHDDWRLRSKHPTNLIVNHTKYIRNEASRPAYHKTLKYVRKFEDMRTGKYEKVPSDRHYYLSFLVIRQLKAVTFLKVIIINGVSSSIFKNLCQILSKLNPTSLILNYLHFYHHNYNHQIDYWNSYFCLLQRMRKLRYLDTGSIGSFHFRPEFELRLQRYKRMIDALPYLTDIKVGNLADKNLREFVNLFLNHEHLKKIQTPILPLLSSEPMQTLFQNLDKIKELDYLCIRTGDICYGEYCETLIYTHLCHFLSSTKSVNTLVVNHTKALIDKNPDVECLLPSQITNIRNLFIEGFIPESLLRMMQAITELDLLQIDINKLNNYDFVIKTVNKILLEKVTLKELSIKFEKYECSILMNLLHNVTLPNLRSFSLDVSQASNTSFNNFWESEYEHAFIEFLRNQKGLQDIVLKLCIPVNFETLGTFLNKIAVLPGLKSITLHLEKSKEILFSGEKDYISELSSFCHALEKSSCLEYNLNPKGYAILIPIKNHY